MPGATHITPKFVNAFSKFKAKMAAVPREVQPNDTEEVADRSSNITKTAEYEADLEQMRKMDFASFSAEEYQAEIQDLFEDLLTFMNRQDSLDELEGN